MDVADPLLHVRSFLASTSSMECTTCWVLSLTVQAVYLFIYFLAGLVIFSLLGFDSVIARLVTDLSLSPA